VSSLWGLLIALGCFAFALLLVYLLERV